MTNPFHDAVNPPPGAPMAHIDEVRADGSIFKGWSRLGLPMVESYSVTIPITMREEDMEAYLDVLGISQAFEDHARSRASMVSGPIRINGRDVTVFYRPEPWSVIRPVNTTGGRR